MPAYHIAGPSGSGKSHVGRELSTRGFLVIETDFAPGLSSWVNKESDTKVTELPPNPLPKEWLDAHAWLWDALKFQELIKEVQDEPVFFVGGAHNEKDFFHLFDKRFGLFTDTPTLISRLREREPNRWINGSAELNTVIDWNDKSKDYNRNSGALLIDSSVPVEIVADNIIREIKV